MPGLVGPGPDDGLTAPVPPVPELVLLPGSGCGVWQWHHLAAAHPGPVLPLELPGHRAEPPLPGPATLDAVVEHVAGRLLGRGPVDLVGHSTGGVVGLVLAVAHPELVRRLVLVDANVPVTDRAVAAKAARVAAVQGPGWRDVLVASMRSSWGPRAPELREAVVAGIAATPERAVRRVWSDVLALDPRPLLAALTVPTLHVRSDRDVDAAALAALNARIAAVDLRALRAGHWPHLLEPAAVTAAIGSFLTP